MQITLLCRSLGLLSVRSPPSLPERLAIKQEKRGDKDEQGLVERPWDGQHGQSRSPAQGLGYPLIPRKQSHRSEQTAEKGSESVHYPDYMQPTSAGGYVDGASWKPTKKDRRNGI